MTAGDHSDEPGHRSARREADLGEPVVQTAALLAEHMQLLQRRVLPGALGRVLLGHKDRGHEQSDGTLGMQHAVG